MRKMERKKTESVNDLEFYYMKGGSEIMWALAPYDSVVLIILKSPHTELQESMYTFFENPVSKAQLEENLYEMSSLIQREVWRIATWGFSQSFISEDEMNSVLFKNSHPQLFFL
jgi:hypothetical protein